MSPAVIVSLIAAWCYLLHILRKAQLNAWRFLAGCLGLFLMLMVWVQPLLTMPLSRMVAAISGLAGDLTGAYSAYFKYGIIFINTTEGSISLQIDLECSGIIEISAFLSLLLFFDVYTRGEKVLVGILGTSYLILCNALRITVICLSVRLFGISAYYIVHTFVGRILFYLLSILLYYFVFTKPQVIRMKVGIITYGHSPEKVS